MTSRSQSRSKGHGDLAARSPEHYQSLKKSLSASFQHVSQSTAEGRTSAEREEEGQRQASSAIGASPFSIDIPKMPAAAEAALAALQHFPTPLLVLSCRKTIILANGAMGRLLGLDTSHQHHSPKDGSQAQYPLGDQLLGQSLSQLGVDMLQDGQRIWVNWEVGQAVPRALHSF